MEIQSNSRLNPARQWKLGGNPDEFLTLSPVEFQANGFKLGSIQSNSGLTVSG
jgi:hypothetical protein